MSGPGENLHNAVEQAARSAFAKMTVSVEWDEVAPLWDAFMADMKGALDVSGGAFSGDAEFLLSACLYDDINDKPRLEVNDKPLSELILENLDDAARCADNLEAAQRSLAEAFRRFDARHPDFYETVPPKAAETGA